MRSTALCGESGGLVPSEVPGQDRDIRWHTLFETWGSQVCLHARERGRARSPMRSTALCGESGGLVPSEVPGQDRDIRWHTLLTWLPLILKALAELISLAVWGGALTLINLWQQSGLIVMKITCCHATG